MSMESDILITENDGFTTISLNRPPANSYDFDFLKRLASVIQDVSANAKTKVILLNSTSEKFFCAGADIKIFSANTTRQNKEMVVAAREVTKAVSSGNKIVIAAIKGHVLGGGLELVMACDIRLASEGNYLIGLPEVKLGLIPGNGGTPGLIDLIGISRATELLITGESMDPVRAYEFGLFNQLYAADQFDKQVKQYVNKLAQGAGSAMATIKQYVRKHKGMDAEEALAFETECVNRLYDTSDAKEGFLAFVEKREPNYL